MTKQRVPNLTFIDEVEYFFYERSLYERKFLRRLEKESMMLFHDTRGKSDDRLYKMAA